MDPEKQTAVIYLLGYTRVGIGYHGEAHSHCFQVGRRTDCDHDVSIEMLASMLTVPEVEDLAPDRRRNPCPRSFRRSQPSSARSML